MPVSPRQAMRIRPYISPSRATSSPGSEEQVGSSVVTPWRRPGLDRASHSEASVSRARRHQSAGRSDVPVSPEPKSLHRHTAVRERAPRAMDMPMGCLKSSPAKVLCRRVAEREQDAVTYRSSCMWNSCRRGPPKIATRVSRSHCERPMTTSQPWKPLC